MKLLLFFLGACIAMALWAQRRDGLPRPRFVLMLIAIVSIGFMSRRMI